QVVRCGIAFGVMALLVTAAVKTPAGIQGSGLQTFSAIGPVTQIGSGSVVVGGDQYATGTPQFQIDDHPGHSGTIQVGGGVSVNAVCAPGHGKSVGTDVSFSGNVRGRVMNIEPAASTFQVLRQNIHGDAHTQLGTGGFAALREGDAIEASGFPDS